MTKRAPSAPVWYSAGLRFTCTECGKCCKDREIPTFVFMEEDDILRLADHFRMSRKAFLRRYCTWDEEEGGYVLRKKPGACIFYDDSEGCVVYPARPVQCRTWPFWPSNLIEDNWKTASEFCPGCDRGKRHSRRDIESQALWMIGRRGEGGEWPEEIPFPV
jgi:Fe-S-cluster containining protein